MITEASAEDAAGNLSYPIVLRDSDHHGKSDDPHGNGVGRDDSIHGGPAAPSAIAAARTSDSRRLPAGLVALALIVLAGFALRDHGVSGGWKA